MWCCVAGCMPTDCAQNKLNNRKNKRLVSAEEPVFSVYRIPSVQPHMNSWQSLGLSVIYGQNVCPLSVVSLYCKKCL